MARNKIKIYITRLVFCIIQFTNKQTLYIYIYINTTQIPRSFIIQIIETASDSVEKVNECMLSGNEMIQHNETIKVKGKNGKKKKKTNGH